MDLQEDLRACLADWDDEAIIQGRQVSGYFTRRPMDEGDGDEVVSGFAQLFGCAHDDAAGVSRGTIIEVSGRGKFRVLRSFGPDESGLVELQLGALL